MTNDATALSQYALEEITMKTDREPTKLIATKLYSSFQICCSVFPANEEYSVHDVFNKVVLYIIDWLRFRSREDEEVALVLSDYPQPEDFHSFDLALLPDIKIKEAFSVNTMFLQDRANWSFRTSEPDNFAEFDDQGPEAIILGRSFITNIAVQENAKYVTLSYKCECKEPKTNKKDCKVFRPKFLKPICRDENFIVKELPETSAQYDRIFEKCISIDTNSISNHLATDLILNEARQLPVLLFTGDKLDEALINEYAERLMGFCHVFLVSEKQFNRLFRARLKNSDIELGDSILYRKGTDYEIIEDEDEDRELIVRAIRRYPVRRNIDYRESLFYREAKIAKFEVINSNDPLELVKQVTQQKEIIENSYKKIHELNADADDLQEQLRSCGKELRLAEESCESYKNLYTTCLGRLETLSQKNSLCRKEIEINRKLLQIVMCFPDRKEDVVEWIQSFFSEQIVVLDRAKSNLLRYNKPLNTKMLCSAIVYLNAYMQCKREQITEEELAFYRLGKPWQIDPCGVMNVERFPEYTIDLSQFNVKNNIDYLSFHLKSGNKRDNLLRIYFSINNELDRIVIGHMPDHLPTTSYIH